MPPPRLGPPRKRVRACVANLVACVCDGQKYNGSIWQMHLVVLGFVPILDFLHLLVHLYAAARAAEGKGTDAAWALYEAWLALAWSGQVGALLRELRAAGQRVGQPPPQAQEGDRRKVVWGAAGYVEGNRDKMSYPEHRRLGLLISGGGGGRDQTTEPAGEGDGEVLAGARGRGLAQGARGLPERPRPGRGATGSSPGPAVGPSEPLGWVVPERSYGDAPGGRLLGGSLGTG